MSNRLIVHDKGLQDPRSKRIWDVNGWYAIENNPLSKVGVYPYYGYQLPAVDGIERDKIYYVLRPTESLQDPEFLNSIKLLPWLERHVHLGTEGEAEGKPAEEVGVEGVIGEQVYFKDGIVYGNIKVFSEDLKSQIQSGKKELSLGYTSRYEYAPGEFEGQKYDFIQRELRGNHLALVEKGRMGSEVAVLDQHPIIKGETMNEHELAEALAKARKISYDEALQIVRGSGGAGPGSAAPTGDMGTHDMTMDGVRGMIREEVPKMVRDALVDVMKDGKLPDTMDMSTHDKTATGDQALKDENEQLAEENKKLKEEKEEADKRLKAADAKVELEEKEDLYKKLSPATGTFDHSNMSLVDMAKYGLDKLKIEFPEGAELAVLNTHLDAVEKSGGRFSVGDEGTKERKPSAVSDYLSNPEGK